jgi:hypothetical protein
MSTFDTSKKNVGQIDRNIRGAVGAFLLFVAYSHQSWGPALIGIALIASAYLRFCPTYALVNYSTHEDQTPAQK